MDDRKSPWVLVLAAGEGTRVRMITRDRWGRRAPKQFTSTDGRQTLLGATLERAKRIAPTGQIVPIVAAHHERWWTLELSGDLSENIIVQPKNRGTAAGILLPVLWIAQHDPDATVVILPSDHHVESETMLNRYLTETVSAVTGSRAPIVLLGVEPDGPEEEYGWIVPCPGPANCPHRVASFLEKPDTCTAASLFADGALLNTFIIVADVRCLFALFKAKVPQLWQLFAQRLAGRSPATWQEDEITDLYRLIPSFDFSRDVLESAARDLWVYPMPSCGWTDLGTPRRLRAHLARRDGRITHGLEMPASENRQEEAP
jgi:mannose-1-phosphate guanylyltransferase